MMRILVTGSNGLVGSALKKIKTNKTFIFHTRNDCDLLDYDSLKKYIGDVNPSFIVHLAADVGGLYKNMNQSVEMFENNILMNTNVIKACYEHGIKDGIFLLSTCIFPDKIEYPITEEKLHLGEPHTSNYGYAYAKRLLEVHVRLYREKYGCNYMCIIPTNIYGEYDNFSLTDGHVIPALIHNCYLAKIQNKPFIVKGTGTPLRQFIFSNDLANIIIYYIDHCIGIDNIIACPTEEYSIKYIANLISKKIGGLDCVFDSSYSDGQYRKYASNDKLCKNIDLEWTSIETGVDITIDWFLKNYSTCRK
jgi:GDP-L-fucose synthase